MLRSIQASLKCSRRLNVPHCLAFRAAESNRLSWMFRPYRMTVILPPDSLIAGLHSTLIRCWGHSGHLLDAEKAMTATVTKVTSLVHTKSATSAPSVVGGPNIRCLRMHVKSTTLPVVESKWFGSVASREIRGARAWWWGAVQVHVAKARQELRSPESDVHRLT